MRMATTVASIFALGLSLGLVGCGSEPPPKEDTNATRQAICSGGGGGGGGGDPCTSTTGFCPAECGYCFSSASQRLELQNLWECTPGGGGGGGGGSSSCSADQTYAAHGLYNMNPGDDPATILAVLCDDARTRAEAACAGSGRVCTAHVGASNRTAAVCGSTGFCECDWETRCSYTWY